MTQLRLTHRRDVWLGDERWISSPAFNWNTVDHIVIHWPGHDRVPDGDLGEFEYDIPPYLRAMQRMYRDVRGYNIGYSIAVDWLGGTWELRGDEFRNAANAPQALNQRTISITVFTDLDGVMTDYAVAAVRDLVAQIRAIRPGAVVIPHRYGPTVVAGATPTQCPGDAITARIERGDFEPVPEPAPAPTPPPEEDIDMEELARLAAQVDALTATVETLTGSVSRMGAALDAQIKLNQDRSNLEQERHAQVLKMIDLLRDAVAGNKDLDKRRYEQLLERDRKIRAELAAQG